MTAGQREKYSYRYPRPMVTVDAVVFCQTGRRLELLSIWRGNEPFKGLLALPGGFVEMDEDLVDAARRELAEETGLTGVKLWPLGFFGKPGRDPRGRNIACAFVGLLKGKPPAVLGGDDAAEAFWIPARRLPEMAFDHNEIVRSGLKWVRERF